MKNEIVESNMIELKEIRKSKNFFQKGELIKERNDS